ncbi:MAG: hypothetical protein AAFV93_12205 [Chloroflexota bacterium]
MMPRFWSFLLLCMLLVGCEAQATPIANIATPTATSAPSPIPVDVVLFGIASNIAPYVGDLPIDFEIVDGNSALSDYDLVVSYGALDGWQQSPQAHRVSLAINPNLSPLNDLTIRDLIPSVLDSQAIVSNLNINGAQQTTARTTVLSSAEIRTTLANSGYPDGFQMIMAIEQVPAIDTLVVQFSALSLDMRLVPLRDGIIAENQAHLALFLWADDSERDAWVALVGEENIVDLWTMPISYITSGDVAIEFSETGIPFPVE